jgi:excisionase family DNA binding protein
MFTIDSPAAAVVMPPSIAQTPPAPNAPLLLRVSAAAELLGVSRSTLYQLIAKGEVPVIRIGRSVRVARRELERIAWNPTDVSW